MTSITGRASEETPPATGGPGKRLAGDYPPNFLDPHPPDFPDVTGGARQLSTLADADLGLNAFAVDDDDVYWLAGKNLMVLRKGEKAAVVDANDVDGFALEGSHVYIATTIFGDGPKLQRHARPTGAVETIVPRYWRGHYSMRVVGEYVYATENAWQMKGAHPAYLLRARKSGGCTELVTTLPNDYFNDVYTDDTRLYWADPKKGEILAVPIQ